ncbi:MAG: hypothetical protein RLY47_60 [Candidatus Parcubacteria bacterium]
MEHFASHSSFLVPLRNSSRSSATPRQSSLHRKDGLLRKNHILTSRRSCWYDTFTMTSDARVYLDYAAGTPLDPSVRDAMRAYEDAHFANAFSVHNAGREAKRMLEDARFGLAAHLGARSNECHFASGATDAMTKILYSVVNGLLEKGVTYAEMHIVMSVIEHSTVRACIEGFARRGVRLTNVGVGTDGRIDMAQMEAAVHEDTILVVCMLVNNEIGTIQPIRDIGRMLEARFAETKHRFVHHHIEKPLLVSDASQAPLFMPLIPSDLGVDFMVIDAAKIYGPRKMALLYVKTGTYFQSLCGMHGKVPSEGTPDVSSSIGLRRAYDILEERREADVVSWNDIKSYFIQRLTERFPTMRINGDPAVSVPGILNVSFPHVEGEFLATQLDNQGVAVSAKSACLSGGGEGSYVVRALDPDRANSALRFSFGRTTTQEDIDYVVSALADIIR